MRFMMIVKACPDSEAGVMPTLELIQAMGDYNEELSKAGVLLAGEGLQSSAKGARVKFSGGTTSVVDGPFAETKELIAGYWIIEAKSRQEAIDWARRVPPPHGDQDAEIEIRQLFDAGDFPADVFPPEEAQREQALREEIEKRAAKR